VCGSNPSLGQAIIPTLPPFAISCNAMRFQSLTRASDHSDHEFIPQGMRTPLKFQSLTRASDHSDLIVTDGGSVLDGFQSLTRASDHSDLAVHHQCLADSAGSNPSLGQAIIPTSALSMPQARLPACSNPSLGQAIIPTFGARSGMGSSKPVPIPHSGKRSFRQQGIDAHILAGSGSNPSLGQAIIPT